MSFWRRSSTLLTGAVLALAASSAYLCYLHFRRTQDEREEDYAGRLRARRYRKVQKLREKLDNLLNSLEQTEPEAAQDEDDECVVCNSAKAMIQTFPCKHKVLCRICFIKALQVAVDELNLPLKCVMCRTKISTLDREQHEAITGGSVTQTSY